MHESVSQHADDRTLLAAVFQFARGGDDDDDGHARAGEGPKVDEGGGGGARRGRRRRRRRSSMCVVEAPRSISLFCVRPEPERENAGRTPVEDLTATSSIK